MSEEVKELEPECPLCKSTNHRYEQDAHNKTTEDGAEWGISTCQVCGLLQYWYFKSKRKLKFEGNKVSMSARPVFSTVFCWDGPISTWLWDKISENSRLTGRPEHTYYTNFGGPNMSQERYFQLEKVNAK